MWARGGAKLIGLLIDGFRDVLFFFFFRRFSCRCCFVFEFVSRLGRFRRFALLGLEFLFVLFEAAVLAGEATGLVTARQVIVAVSTRRPGNRGVEDRAGPATDRGVIAAEALLVSFVAFRFFRRHRFEGRFRFNRGSRFDRLGGFSFGVPLFFRLVFCSVCLVDFQFIVVKHDFFIVLRFCFVVLHQFFVRVLRFCIFVGHQFRGVYFFLFGQTFLAFFIARDFDRCAFEVGAVSVRGPS